jgi:hypothetical protein
MADKQTDKVDVTVPGTTFTGTVEVPSNVTEKDLADSGMTEAHRESKK